MNTIPQMPTARYDMGVAVIGKMIFAIGGFSGEYLKTVEVLDTQTNEWSTLSPIPTARYGMGIAVIDDRFIWTFGGLGPGGDLNVIEIFDVEKNEWKTAPTKMPSLHYSSKAFVVGDQIFFIGGQRSGSGGGNEVVDVLDMKTLIWKTCCSMTTPRKWHSAIGF